jgi:hypothetical protein
MDITSQVIDAINGWLQSLAAHLLRPALAAAGQLLFQTPASSQNPELGDSRQTGTSVALGDGMVTGGPRRWLRIEGATVLVGSLVAYWATRQPWWLVR